jgi:multiple sugar transport system substrate-binding protein
MNGIQGSGIMSFRRFNRLLAAAFASLMLFATAACGQRDTRTLVTVWSWEPSMKALAVDFEQAEP